MNSPAPDVDWKNALERAQAHSPFLGRLLNQRQDLADLLSQGDGETALALAKRAGERTADTGLALRQERNALALALGIGDLAGAFSLQRVMAELSAFADRGLNRAIEAAIGRYVPDAQPTGFVALALGKHGAGELNYSSDIDPILLYDPETLPRRDRDEPGEAAQRYAREVVRLLSDTTDAGYVFRVDLRLRPASEVSPLAISIGAATTHYESLAMTWERAAFIRARAAAGDVACGEAFLETIRPFVWRRSLDFGAIDEIRRLSLRIREQHTGPRRPAPGYNVKLGQGGIREAEFFAQTHQLIHGGRNPSLRLRGTGETLDALAEAGLITIEEAKTLGQSYDRLRIIEHRLQMVADRQTHSLPSGEALANVAQLSGYQGGDALIADLEEISAPVRDLFSSLIERDGEDADAAQESAHALADELHEVEPDGLAARVMGWSDGRYRALKSAAAIEAFDAIRPSLLTAMADSDDPQMALARWETLLERLPNAINFFRLLEARPALFDLLCKCLVVAPPLAQELARRPELLDILIDHSAFDLPGSVHDLVRQMQRGEADDDYERRLDRIRIVTGEKRFALGMQLIEAVQEPLDIAAGLSRVAEAAIQVAVAEASAEFARQHGRIAGAQLLVLGLGRLGGGALTHASDLDLIYLFTEGDAEESDGPRPLGRTLYFNRLAQRVSAALSVPTAEGALYEVDTRLRPQGKQGPLAVSLPSFEKYQREEAWTWEHMALMRARVIAVARDTVSEAQNGLSEWVSTVSETLDTLIEDVACKSDDVAALHGAILEMRATMAENKPAKGPLDAKLLRGGLVDLEFVVHAIQLRTGCGVNADLAVAIKELAEAGLASKELGEAYAVLTRILVGTRLLAPDLSVPREPAASVLAAQAHCRDLTELQSVMNEARQVVAQHWLAEFGQKLEID